MKQEIKVILFLFQDFFLSTSSKDEFDFDLSSMLQIWLYKAGFPFLS